MNKCDVIIPIYNAYDCLTPCIESVIKNTDLNNNRLILIDDKSPDEKVLPLLEKYANGKNIILLKNEENLGFVGTVNKGMKYSDNDVLLLNSDTEVTKDWLKKIQEKAYSEPNISSVTPMSNNATLVSTPVGLQRNILPDHITLEEMGELVEKTAYDGLVELPTAHGFCMFIKREVLNEIGYFDEEKYGKGYGEETDFSFRCLDYGYRNVMCQNVYILHKESQSFSEKRAELAKAHGELIQKDYPIYNSRIGVWCQTFPILKDCENLSYQIEMFKRKNMLMLIHDWSNLNENVGGTTLHLLDLIKNLRNDYNVHVLYPENGIYKLKSYFKDTEKELKFDSIDSCNNYPMYNSKYKKMIELIIKGFRIDTLHVHHMIGHCLDVIDVAKKEGVYSIISLHDFYSVCPTINMLYNMETFCDGLKDKNCKECIKHKTTLINDVTPVWQKKWNEFLSKFDKVIVPSNSVKKIINKYYKDIKIDVIPHGIDIDNNNYTPELSNEINIAFVGVMAKHKGAALLQELINSNSKYKFHLFGVVEYEGLDKNKSNYTFHGKYNRNNIGQLLKENNIDLVCMLSITPETFSYTLSEVSASGIPTLSFNIGALGERISEGKLGWTMNPTSNVKDILNKLDEIFNNKEEYKKVVNKIKTTKVRTTADMTNDYIPFYKKGKWDGQLDESYESLRTIIKNNYEIKESVASIEAQKILNSTKWKIVSRINVPSGIKKIIKKVIK